MAWTTEKRAVIKDQARDSASQIKFYELEKELDREIRMRISVYQKQIDAKKLSIKAAIHQLACMYRLRQIVRFMRTMEQETQQTLL